jgi:hypothetical protein
MTRPSPELDGAMIFILFAESRTKREHAATIFSENQKKLCSPDGIGGLQAAVLLCAQQN